MFARLPSPSALRTFEAAARLGSFKAAARELSVTPTAVSHQVRALEEHLGVPLFVRRTRAVELTESGRRLADAAHQAFGLIAAALEGLPLSALRPGRQPGRELLGDRDPRRDQSPAELRLERP